MVTTLQKVTKSDQICGFDKKKNLVSVVFLTTYEILLYPEPGSNRHRLPYWCLRPARLPIPPSGPVLFFRIAVQRYKVFWKHQNKAPFFLDYFF